MKPCTRVRILIGSYANTNGTVIDAGLKNSQNVAVMPDEKQICYTLERYCKEIEGDAPPTMEELQVQNAELYVALSDLVTLWVQDDAFGYGTEAETVKIRNAREVLAKYASKEEPKSG